MRDSRADDFRLLLTGLAAALLLGSAYPAAAQQEGPVDIVPPVDASPASDAAPGAAARHDPTRACAAARYNPAGTRAAARPDHARAAAAPAAAAG